MARHWRAKPTGGIPRGVATDGIALLSYGFRPFFLAAGLFAPLAMLLWLGALTGGWEIGGAAYGPVNWHAREMLFGYTTAALTGFLLTTIPNWTGRLPVSGGPLLAIALLWVSGRVAMAAPDVLGQGLSAAVDSAFLPLILLISVREIVAGKNWRNLKIIAALGLLAAINIAFHAAVAFRGDPGFTLRAAVAVYVCLIALVGGRIVPSFTRNWLAKTGAKRFPAPFDGHDLGALIVLVLAVTCWTILPNTELSAALTALAAALHLVRLARWRGLATAGEPMLIVLHVGYAFVPVGLAALSLSTVGWISAVAALHLLTVGAIGNMTLAVMTRATLGHTARPIRASGITIAAFVAVFIAAAVRPLADVAPDYYFPLLAISGGAWILAFLIFCIEFGPMLLRPRLQVSTSRLGNASSANDANTETASDPA